MANDKAIEKISRAGEYALLIAWLLAVIATVGALYASEILKMAVCPLCWYQRICIFPLSLQLGIATFRNDLRIAIYAIPLVVVGAILALYQYLIQMIPALAPFTPCRVDSSGVSCETIEWQLFGFITFPLLSLIACIAITVLLAVRYKSKN